MIKDSTPSLDPVNHENTLLKSLLKQWTPTDSPPKYIGIDVFLSLAKQSPITQNSGIQSLIQKCHISPPVVTPTLHLCIEDLLSASPTALKITSFPDMMDVDHVPPARVLSSVLLSTIPNEHRDEDPRDHAFLGITQIPFTERGLGTCCMHADPFQSDHHYTLKMAPGNMKAPYWTSSIFPVGAVTKPDFDIYGAAKLITHIEGHALWLFWPCTPKNVNVLRQSFAEPNSRLTLHKATELLEGEELHLINGSLQRFYIPSGVIHCMIAFTMTCYTELRLWSTNELAGAELAMDILLESEIKMSAAASATSIEEEVLCHWEVLANNCQDSDILLEVQRFLEISRQRLRQRDGALRPLPVPLMRLVP